LWGKQAEVIGRRVDSDDVLVCCPDGTFATVHLDWAEAPHSRSREFPTMEVHLSTAALQRVIDADATDYGEED